MQKSRQNKRSKRLRKIPQLVKTVRKLICKSDPFFEKPVRFRGDSSKKGRRLDSTRDDGGYLVENDWPVERELDGIAGEVGHSSPAIFATGSIEDPARRWEPLSVRCTIRDEDTSRSRKCTRRGHSVPESRIPRQLLIHRGLLNVVGARNGDKKRAECEGGDKSGEP